jgi:Zn-dependent protease
VLLIHELGHFLAMKAFGYKNLNIIFTPPFGAVATGTKEIRPPLKKSSSYSLGRSQALF